MSDYSWMGGTTGGSIRAIRDDGSPEGVLRAELTRSIYRFVPWREGQVFTIAGGAPSGGSQPSVGLTAGDNLDGSNGYFAFIITETTASLPSSSWGLRVRFRGPVFGVRFDPTYTTGGGGLFDFGVLIDGTAYRVRKDVPLWDTRSSFSIPDGSYGVIVDESLTDDWHIADIIFPVGATQNGQFLYGMILDGRYYPEFPRRGYPTTPAAMTNAYATILTGSTGYRRGLSLAGILYVNLDSATRVFSIQSGGVTVWQKSVAAGDSYPFDPLRELALDIPAGTWKHKVDAITTTAPNYTAIVAN